MNIQSKRSGIYMKKVGSDLYDDGTDDEMEIEKTKSSAGAALAVSLGILVVAIVLGAIVVKTSVNAMIP